MIVRSQFRFRKWILFTIVGLIILVNISPIADKLLSKFNSVSSRLQFSFKKLKFGQLLDLYTRTHGTFEIYKGIDNCGIPYSCTNNSFALHINIGKEDEPSVFCYQGKYYQSIIGNDKRGLNIVIIEPVTMSVKEVINIDTYEISSLLAELWLETFASRGDIVIMYTTGEATKNLEDTTKSLLLKEYGSGKISNLEDKGHWCIITVKGILPYTPYEEISYSVDGEWADPIYEQLCLP